MWQAVQRMRDQQNPGGEADIDENKTRTEIGLVGFVRTACWGAESDNCSSKIEA